MPLLKARHLLLIQAILAVALGVLLLFWPGFMMTRYSLPLSLAGAAFGRLFGVTLTGFGLLLWATTKVTGARAQILILGALFLANGRTNKEIAEALVVSQETVKTHVGNILAKLQLAHRTQAVIYALKQGLISLDELEVGPEP